MQYECVFWFWWFCSFWFLIKKCIVMYAMDVNNVGSEWYSPQMICCSVFFRLLLLIFVANIKLYFSLWINYIRQHIHSWLIHSLIYFTGFIMLAENFFSFLKKHRRLLFLRKKNSSIKLDTCRSCHVVIYYIKWTFLR